MVGSPTQMRIEIGQQPDAVARTLQAMRPLRADVAALGRGRRIVFAARGSSDNAAIYGRYLLEVCAGVNASLSAPSIATHYRARLDLRDVLFVSISQSGETDEIVQTQHWAAEQGAATLAVTNVAGSSLAREADLAFVTAAGPEYAVPATKTFVTQLAALVELTLALGPTHPELERDLDRVPGEIERLIREFDPPPNVVTNLAEAAHTVVSGRGLVLSTALEVALKLEETCLRPVRGYSYADLKHGPVAAVGEDVSAILLSADGGQMLAPMRDLAESLARRGARTIGIGGDDAFARACDFSLPGTDLPEALAPLALVVPGQLLVERLARHLGLDPDAPGGLSKVTSTDRRGTKPKAPTERDNHE